MPRSFNMSQSAYSMILTPLFPEPNQPFSQEYLSQIIVRSDATDPTVLGRNTTTQIKDMVLSRSLCDIMVDSSGKMYLSMKKVPGQHHVYLDGSVVESDLGCRVEIDDGSTLSLYQEKYPYRVSLKKTDEAEGVSENDPTAMAPKRESSEEETKNIDRTDTDGHENVVNEEKSILQQSQKSLMQEMTCSICMEIIVKATVANPCGHCFCGSCIDGTRKRNEECPNCRAQIHSTTWTRHTDSVIFHMILTGQFEFDDVMHFLRRSGKQLTSEEMACMQHCTAENQKKRNNPPPINNIQLQKRPRTDITTFPITAQQPRKRVKGNVITYFHNYPVHSTQGMHVLTSFAPMTNARGGSSANDAIVLD